MCLTYYSSIVTLDPYPANEYSEFSKMKKIVLLFLGLLILVFGRIHAQEKTLTKLHMYEDFDEMVSILQDCNPQLAVRKTVTGIDQTRYFTELRARIDTIDTYASFVIKVLNHLLIRMYDIHAVMARELYPFDNTEGIDPEAVRRQREEMRKRYERQELHYNPCKPFCTPLYVNGDYYIKGRVTFVSRGKEDTVRVTNAKILSYNGIPYAEYVIRYSPHDMRWDHNRKKYYALNSSFPKCSGLLELEYSGKTVTIDLKKFSGIILEEYRPFHTADYATLPLYPHARKNPRVHYFKEDKILYIHLYKMDDDGGVFAERVKKTAKGKEITKLIIDVRDNNGGNDQAWYYLLQAIIADSLPDRSVTAFRNSDRIKRLYTNSPVVQNIANWEVRKFAWLPGEEFLVSATKPVYIVPDSNSLNYKGPIYVVQNENTLSSAQAFTAFATHSDRFTTVGVPTGLLGGRGITPALFQLPHSQFSFRLETALDVTDVRNPADAYHDTPEINVDIPFEESFKTQYCKYIYDQYSPEYLYRHDFIFRQILKMK